MNLTLHERGQKLFSDSTYDVLGILVHHFNTYSDQELATCINGSIYCLLNVRKIKSKAIEINLKEQLANRSSLSNNEQLQT
mmetsp:Transcript_44036/g.42615  ORF Transcript_44036/g.42615 Transcript_44036/m.42615 type:complete len:81 (+) Transcript_44036:1547-1789(+)